MKFNKQIRSCSSVKLKKIKGEKDILKEEKKTIVKTETEIKTTVARILGN